ncbi:MAG: hypothetical protein CMG60_04400 [Candidatus Marinimicrobia bacterium]|nr:hypothetical protein [Candidatus Neomarinimicrobiota bacterium]
MKRRPLFLQLFYTFMPMMVIGIVALIFFINSAIRDFYYLQTKDELLDRASLVSIILEQTTLNSTTAVQKLIKKLGMESNMRITLIDSNGLVIGDSEQEPINMDNHSSRPEVVEAKKDYVGSSQRFSKTLQENMMYLAIIHDHDKKSLIVRVSKSLAGLNDTIYDLQKRFILIGLFVGFLILLLSYYFSQKVTVPLQHIRKKTETFVNTLNLSNPLPNYKTKELSSLSQSLNKMAIEIDKRIRIIERERNDREFILSSMQAGIIALNKKLKILSINKIAIDYLDLNENSHLGYRAKKVIKNKRVIKLMKNVLAGADVNQEEIIIKKNKRRTFLVNGTQLKKQGVITGILVVLNDITLQKQLENIRQDFVANVSHELKTPITSILGYVELLKEDMINDSQRTDFLNRVLKQANRMNLIIDDLLRLSKIESQEEDSTIELQKTLLIQILEDAKDDLLDSASNHQNKINIYCDEGLFINADSQLLREAVSNLIENGIKYGHKGKEINLIGKNRNEKTEIHIDNHGDQIAPSQHKKIFQRFYRVDKSRDREAGGTGLGLSIVKHIAFVHNGEVSTTNMENGVTRFTISLPRV